MRLRLPASAASLAAMDSETIVRDFCAAFGRQDLDEIVGFFSDDAVYHNIPMEPAVGIAAIEAMLRMFVAEGGDAEFEIVHLAVAGHAVLTERVDRLQVQGKPVEIKVMGTFELNDAGKIRAWRDYFDLGQLMSQIG